MALRTISEPRCTDIKGFTSISERLRPHLGRHGHHGPATVEFHRFFSMGKPLMEGKIIELWRIFHKSLAKLRVNRKIIQWMNLWLILSVDFIPNWAIAKSSVTSGNSSDWLCYIYILILETFFKLAHLGLATKLLGALRIMFLACLSSSRSCL